MKQLRIMHGQTAMMTKQMAMMEEQNDASKRMEKLAHDQAAITARQGQIAEAQHRISTEQHQFHLAQQAKRTDLRLRAPVQDKYGVEPTSDINCTLQVTNEGTRTADGFYWEVLIHQSVGTAVEFRDIKEGAFLERRWAPVISGQDWFYIEGHYPHRLFPGAEADVVHLMIHPRVGDSFRLLWKIRTEDRLQPDSGFFTMDFTRNGDFYHTSYETVPVRV